jgi:hypothetical protein
VLNHAGLKWRVVSSHPVILDDYEVLGLASVNFQEIFASVSFVLFSLVLAWRTGSAVD